MWSTGEENGKWLQYSCLENPINSMKRQKDRTLKDELLRSVRCWAGTSMFVHPIPLKCKPCEGRILSVLFIILSPESILSNWHLEAIPCLLQHKNGFVWLFDCFVSHFVPASLSVSDSMRAWIVYILFLTVLVWPPKYLVYYIWSINIMNNY